MLNTITPKPSSLIQKPFSNSFWGWESRSALAGDSGSGSPVGLPSRRRPGLARRKVSLGFRDLLQRPLRWLLAADLSSSLCGPLHRATHHMAADFPLSQRPKRERANQQARSSSILWPHLGSCFPSCLLYHVYPETNPGATWEWTTRERESQGTWLPQWNKHKWAVSGYIFLSYYVGYFW